MAKSEFASLLPESRRVNDVFYIAIQKYGFRFTSTRQVYNALAVGNPRVQPFFRDVIETGVAHFALRGQDDIMRTVGESTMQQLKSGNARTYLTSDVKAAALAFELPDYLVRAATPHSPLTVVDGLIGIQSERDTVRSLVPFDILVGVFESPVEVLGYIAAFSSMVRDAANQRSVIDPDLFVERAACVEARFIRHVMQTEPDVKIPEYYRDILTAYTEERFQEINYRNPPIPLDPRVN